MALVRRLLYAVGMNHRLLTAIAGLGIAALAACTTTVSQFEDDGGSGGNGSGGTGSGGNGTQCEGFEDTTERADVTVSIRNATAAPIYLTGLGCDADIDLRLYDEDDQRIDFRAGVCHFTCEELQQSEAICAADCAIPPIVMIAPGGSYDMPWDGTIHRPAQMPESCYLNPEYATQGCDRRTVAPAATYQFEVSAHDDSWCPLDQPGACTCTPDASGSCTFEQPYGEIVGEGRPARADLVFPSETRAEIVFE